MEAFFDDLSRGLAKSLTRREAFRVTLATIAVALWPHRAVADSGTIAVALWPPAPVCCTGGKCCGDCVAGDCTKGLCITNETCCKAAGLNWGCRVTEPRCCFVGGCCPAASDCCPVPNGTYTCCDALSLCTFYIDSAYERKYLGNCCEAGSSCYTHFGLTCCPTNTDTQNFCAHYCPPPPKRKPRPRLQERGFSAIGAPSSQQPTGLLYNFAGSPNAGATPLAGLIQDPNGTFYGTTNAGGSRGLGTVFQMAPDGSTHMILHNFGGGSSDGANPDAALFQGSNGTLYGTTQAGGPSNVGTVFSMDPDGSGFTVLHSFSGGSSGGAIPHGGVIQGLDGKLYGTTSAGGSADLGTISRMASDGSGFTILHEFTAGAEDGADANGGLIQGPGGTLYGMTVAGGTGNSGTIFSIAPDGTAFTLIHVFSSGTSDGGYPFGALIRGGDGTLYGTTRAGGSTDLGTVFRIAPDGSGFTILHNFTGNPTDGAHPFAGLIQGSDDKLYGTTVNGGTNRVVGTIFQLAHDGSTYSVQHVFDVDPSDGALPFASVLQARDGTLYVTTSQGGANSNGAVYRLTIGRGPASGAFFGDRNASYAVFRPSDGTWYALDSNTPDTLTQQWGTSGDVPLRGDFDGDGMSDFAVWRPSNGEWFIIPSSNPSVPMIQQWGTSGDIPVPGDYDGDGKTDIAVWRPSNGTWFIIPSSGAPIVQQWGTLNDIPVPGDYDGDGKTDIAVWRPSDGTWYVILSSTGMPITQQWGATLNGVQDIPVPGDFDGDGKTDIAVWRPSNGNWFVIPSSDPSVTMIQQWGTSGDIPVPVDYDDDTITDIAVWRPSTGIWWVIPSSSPSTFMDTQWGASGDVPVQRPIGQ